MCPHRGLGLDDEGNQPRELTAANANAILNLATGSFGPQLTENLVRSGEILSLSREQVRPWYEAKRRKAVAEGLRGIAEEVQQCFADATG